MSNRTPVPERHRQPEQMLTDPQKKFILGLMQDRDLSQLTDQQQIWLEETFIQEIHTWPTKTKASSIIKQLLALPKLAKGTQPDKYDYVPAGRYAVENSLGELRFYRVWRPKDNPNVFKLYVLHGPDSSEVRRNAAHSIMSKIYGDGVRESAIRYGNEIGACSNCGRRLTNRISRELGIGPICGGRMFGDEFGGEVTRARERIEARGEDPDEEISS